MKKLKRPLRSDWGGIARNTAILSLIMVGGANAVGNLEKEVTTFTTALTGNILNGILGVAYGYRGIALFNELKWTQLFILTLMVAVIVVFVSYITGGTIASLLGIGAPQSA